MTHPVHYSPNLIYSVGTQVVALRAVQGSDGKAVHPSGAVGVVVRSPREYGRLVAELESAAEKSALPERSSGKDALGKLLVRLRLGGYDL